MKANTHRLCTANLLQSFFNQEKQIVRPSPLATPQPPHPPKAPEAASRRSRHGCAATPPWGCRVHHAGRATRHWELAATQWTEFESKAQSPTSPGESSARLPAGLRPHRHLWCHPQSTWSAQKGTVGIKGRPSVAAALASDFCKSDHLQLSISHFWPFNVAKCCQRNSRHNGLNITLGITALGGIPPICPIYSIKPGLWGTCPWELYRIKNSYDTNTMESKTNIPVYTP